MFITADELAGLLAREYLRVSQDATGKLESPGDQHDDNVRDADRFRIVFGSPYAEPEAVSASRRSRKERKEFRRLLADLDGGQFGAKILWLWDVMRGGRSVRDWSDLIDACEQADVWIYVTRHHMLYDASNGHDRQTLHRAAADAEADNESRRDAVLRGTIAAAAKGRAPGRIPYGYTRLYHPVTRELTEQKQEPAEARNVRELFARLHEGHSLRSIEADWKRRGILSRGSAKVPARPFSSRTLALMAVNPTYAGKRVRQPKGTKRRNGSLEGAVDAVWPGIVEPEVFYAVREMMLSPSRRPVRDGRAVHLLSRIARCGRCGGYLTVAYRGEVRGYMCRGGGCVRLPAGPLDELAETAVLAYLQRPDVAALVTPAPENKAELTRVRKELAAARGELGDWQAKAARREVSAGSFAVIEPPLLAGIARLEEAERRLSVPSQLAGWTGPGAPARWKAAPVEARRRIARLLLSPAYIGTLFVDPAGSGNRVPVADRVRADRGNCDLTFRAGKL